MEIASLSAIVLVEIVPSTALLLAISVMDLQLTNVYHVFLESCQEVAVYLTAR